MLTETERGTVHQQAWGFDRRLFSTDRRGFLQQLSLGAVGIALLGQRHSSLYGAEGNRLIVHSQQPFNAEPPLADLVTSWITPIESFFVRNHGNLPQVDPATFRLSVEGLVEAPQSLSLTDLNRFEQHSVAATLTCAGNRRAEHSLIKPVKGVLWQAGAIGNARWSGARLAEILKSAGIRESAKHVWFEGLDTVTEGGQTFSFGGSIPLEKVLTSNASDQSRGSGPLVATMMNDQPLTPEHGFPVRMVVPGYIGARSVKWLSKIIVSDKPSPNHFVADVYKLVDEGTPLEVAETAPIYRFPLNAVICRPSAGAAIRPGRVELAGYALPPGLPGALIGRVEVSSDGARTWTDAKLSMPANEFCWQFWSAAVDVNAQTTELIVRATDSRGEQQPATVRWNAKGYLFNAWHRVPVKLAV